MKQVSTTTERQLALKVVQNLGVEERIAVANWAEQLLAIKRSDYSKLIKGREAIQLTARSRIILPILKVIAKELKLDQIDIKKVSFSSYKQTLKSLGRFWKNRSLPVQLGISASTLAAVIFGSQGAGIAALGTAVGVPLWVVFGAGATFAGVMYEEITGKKPDSTTTYRVIDAVKKPNSNTYEKLRGLIRKK